MFVNKLFTYLTCVYMNVKFSTYCFLMKTEILADFQIRISVPLRWNIETMTFLKQ